MSREYTDEQRKLAMAALLQAAKDCVAVVKKMAPEIKAIGKQFADAIEDIAGDKK